MVLCIHARETTNAARPLIASSIFLTMVIVLLYMIITYPRPFQAQLPPEHLTTELIKTPQDVIGPYDNLSHVFYQHQIPLFNKPYFYKVELKMNVPWNHELNFGDKNFTMDGSVKMHFTVEKANKRVQVHSHMIHIYEDIRLEDDFGRNISILRINRQYTHVVDIELEHDLFEHMNYTIFIKFTSTILHKRVKVVGLQSYGVATYVSEYLYEGKSRMVLSTHSQPQWARYIFPCIDVPVAKARFQLTMHHPKNTIALFNSKENTTVEHGNWLTTTFVPTPIMSTYIFCIGLVDYSYTEIYRNGVRFRVYGFPNHLKYLQWILTTVVKGFDFYEEYFGIPYVGDKLDFLPVPKLDVQAMENWGLITMKMSRALNESETVSPSDQFISMQIILHEVAHMWFGNLATMKWWNDLWLNEGFAQFMARKAAENVTGYQQDENPTALAISLRSNEQAGWPAISRRDHENYDPKTQFQSAYSKPMIILIMVEKIVGEEAFQKGAGRYLERFRFSNADHKDLMECLTYVYDSSSGGHLSGQSFSLNEFIAKWIYQQGFPVISVRNQAVGVQLISQSGCQPRRHQNWKVPIFNRHPVTKKEQLKWLLENEEVALDLEDDIIADRDVVNFVRILYDDVIYSRITKKLLTNHEHFPVQSRARLLDDSFSFAEKGNLSYLIPFRLSSYLQYERDYAPVSILHAHLDFINSRLCWHPEFDQVKSFVKLVLGPLFDHFTANPLKWDSSYLENSLRRVVYKRVCAAGYSKCESYSFDLVDELMVSCQQRPLSQCSKLPLHYRNTVYATAVSFGPSYYFDFFLEKLAIESNLNEKRNIWYALAATTKEDDTHRFLKAMLAKATEDDSNEEEGIKSRVIDYSKFNHASAYHVAFIHERREKFATELSFGQMANLLLICIRCELLPEQDKMFFEIKDVFIKRYPELKSATESGFARIKGLRSWRASMADHVIRNITAVLDEMKVINDDG